MNPSWSHITPAYHVRDPFSNMGQFGHPAPVASQGFGHSQYEYAHQPIRGFNVNPYFPPQPHRPQQSFMQQPSYNPPSNGMDFSIGSFSIGNFGSNEETRSGPQGGASSPNSRTFETGIIEKLLHSYGFIQCCERQARLFFHFSQFEGNIEHLRIGDPVQFEVTFDKRNGKPIASAVSKITPESAVGEERVTGVVTTELKNGEGQGRISYENRGECFFLPYTADDVEGNVTLRVGDTVSFQMTTSQRTGNLGALYIRLENLAQPVRYKGVVCAIRDGVGYIERADVVREISFKLAEAADLGNVQLGDEVEFNIETRNGEEYACRMTRLPAGTVVFEDVDADVLKGQVVKPLDRSVPVNPQDPLPGRLRFRGRDRSENAVPFGEKDQKGNYTLRHGDWVQFNIATDRRDKLQRATNIELLDESFAFSGERRENGVVASLKEGGGFIKCAEREAPLPFSIDEWITPDQELTVGDEVEFTVLQEPTAASKLSAIRMKGLPPGTVQFEVVIQTDLNGAVTKEPAIPRPGSKLHDRTPEESGLVSAHRNGAIEHFPFVLRDSDFRNVPKLGDEVTFDLAQVKRNKDLIAVNLRVVPKPRVPTPPTEKPKVEMKAQKPKIAEKLFENGVKMQNGYKEKDDRQVYQGWVAAIKDAYGFIETLEHDREIFFHFSNYEGSLSNLDIGQEVQYTVTSKGQPQGKLSAENVRPLAKGSIARPPTGSHVYYGTVIRPVRGNNPEQPHYSGLVKVGELDGDGVEYEYGVTSLANKKDFLQRGDLVQFQLEGEEGGIMRATNVKAMRTKLRSTVDHMKGQYGFLNYEVDDGKKLFFHMSEVKDDVNLQPGDPVEFYLITNQKTGKSSASNVVKMDSQRPERLIQRLRAVSVDETNNGPRIHVVRQPRGPDGSKGFKSPL